MKCSKCGGQLRVTHTYQAGLDAKTQRMVCKKCKRCVTAVTMVSDVDEYGSGASAVAKRISKRNQ